MNDFNNEPGNYKPDDFNQYNMNYPQNPMDARVGFGRRFGAAIIDSLIILTLILIVFSYTGFWDSAADYGREVTGYIETNNEQMINVLTERFLEENKDSLLFSGLLVPLYFFLEVLIGASLGKLILGIKIGGLELNAAEGSKLTLRWAFKQSSNLLGLLGTALMIEALSTISSLLFLLVFVGFFFTLGEKKQSFHDMLAGTAVYFKEDIK